jgi:hypothetical protein
MMDRSCGTCGDEERCVQDFDGETRRKRQRERPRHVGEYNIKKDLRGIGWEGMDWIHQGSGYGQVAGSCEHGNEPSFFIKYGEFLD